MSWIEQNLDAYRVIAEILIDLRPLVRDRLEAKYGKEWFKDGIPEPVFERLIQSKELETSIDWYENRYQEVIDYAVFSDLFEIVTANPELFQSILKLAPSQSLLNTRFLELEVMRSKIGRARQVSDAEINFLTSFHLRFRKAMQDVREAPVAKGGAPGRDGETVDEDRDEGAETGTDSKTPPAAAEADDSPDQGADQGDVAATNGQPESPDRPPLRLAPATKTGEPEAEQADEIAVEIDGDEPAEQSAEAKRETTSAVLQRAMENDEHLTVLRELYREVTGIAEIIWTTQEIPKTAIWDRVSTNPWYEKNFSKLSLRPLSDFYGIISHVRGKRKGGAPKTEIQSYLNDSNFATILLALRDMFQKHQI